MSVPTNSDTHEEDSQLGLLDRIQLLIKNPQDAFALFSFKEKRTTSLVIFFSYFLIKFPIVLQRPYLEGKFNDLSISSSLAYLLGGFIAGIVFTLALFLITAWIIHLILNIWKKSGQCFEDAFTLLVLSLAPQLLLIFELPFLLTDYAEINSFFSVLILRLVVDLLSLRVFYWGLITHFKVMTSGALAVIVLPALTLIFLIFKLIAD